MQLWLVRLLLDSFESFTRTIFGGENRRQMCHTYSLRLDFPSSPGLELCSVDAFRWERFGRGDRLTPLLGFNLLVWLPPAWWPFAFSQLPSLPTPARRWLRLISAKMFSTRPSQSRRRPDLATTSLQGARSVKSTYSGKPPPPHKLTTTLAKGGRASTCEDEKREVIRQAS